MNKQQRLVLLVSILASFVAFLDGSVVSVALPAIVRELGGGLVTQQWVTDAYLITLGALILAAGSFSDIFGRKKILTVGLYGFGVASVLCAIAPTAEFLIVARALQGIAGALLVPSSLALIISSFSGSAQAKAIGSWTAWTGIAFIIGPLVGGLMVDFASWRLVFAINIVPILASAWLLSLLKVQDDQRSKAKIDYLGIILGVMGLGGTVYALIEQMRLGWGNPLVYGTFVIGVIALIIFMWHERRIKQPMLPMELFKVRNFSFGNVATFFIYGALSLQGFLLVIFLQQVAHYSALMAGLASLPVTLLLFVLSSRFGALSGKFGPRFFMTVGPLTSGAGMLLMLRVNETAEYWTHIFPAIMLFGIGLAATVAPLTSAILGSIKSSQAGIGSAVNNAVARIAGLLSIAVIGFFVNASLDLGGFQRGLIVCVVLFVIGGIVSAIGIRNSLVKTDS
ncbi:MAG: MFS transporter [Candidatus Saccharibacteria bacterium]